MKKIRLLLSCLLIIAGLLLAACSGAADTVSQPTNSAPSDTGGGNGTNADFVLDPANATGDNALAAIGYLYEGLVRIQDGAPVGALAESFTVSEDGLDYIFDLRSDVSFHDGSALNADLVIANFNRWFDPNDVNRGSGEFAAWAENFSGFKGETTEDGKSKSQYDGIEKVNDFTVLVHLNTPDPDFLTKLTNPAFSIASPGAFAAGDGGSGSYKVSAGSATSLTLEPFSAYWDSAAIPSQGMEVPLK
jgi:peptide/nickel transport system substrate-binding protein